MCFQEVNTITKVHLNSHNRRGDYSTLRDYDNKSKASDADSFNCDRRIYQTRNQARYMERTGGRCREGTGNAGSNKAP